MYEITDCLGFHPVGMRTQPYAPMNLFLLIVSSLSLKCNCFMKKISRLPPFSDGDTVG